MPDLKNIDEHFVQNVWNEQRFFAFELAATDGRSIQVLKPGVWNSDEGPDFVHAEIQIDGKLHTGDVEIHVRSSEWYDHEHHLNPRYNRVVLHVVFWHDDINLRTRVQNGARIPTVELLKRLDAPIGDLFDEREETEAERINCRVTGNRLKIEPLKSIFDQLGQERLLEKVDAMRSLRVGIDFEQLLYEGIMEALGYAKNRKPFRELAQRVPFSELIGRSDEEIQAVLFGVAGLLPSQSFQRLRPGEVDDPFIHHLESLWLASEASKAPTRMTAEQWRFAKMRPANYPTRRIPAISQLLGACDESLMSVFLPMIEAAATADRRGLQRIRRKLLETLMPPSAGYWAEHSHFGKGIPQKGAALIGKDRASDIIVNILLPIALVWADDVQSPRLRDAVQRLYDSHPKLQANHITQQVEAQIFTTQQPVKLISPSAKTQQGALFIYRNFCSSQLCDDCPIIGGGAIEWREGEMG
jgi:hypothetical protein